MPARDDELASLLLATVPRLMSDLRRHIGARPMLTLSEMGAIRTIGLHEGTTLGALALQLGIGRSAASKIVQSLVEKGHVERKVSEADRRQTLLRLSTRSRATWKKIRETSRAKLASRLADLTATERAALIKGLRGLDRILAASS